MAKGSYVTFADSDDWMHPEKIEYSLTTMKKIIISQSICKDFKEGKNMVQWKQIDSILSCWDDNLNGSHKTV